MASGVETFEFVWVPADSSVDLSVRSAEAGWAGDQLPELLRAAFAGGTMGEQAVRAHARRHLGERASKLDIGNFRAAVAKGVVETFTLVHACEENGHEGVFAYLDECALLKALPRNERACSLARACGFDGAAFHGDVFVGRVRMSPEPSRNASFGLAEMASDALWLRRAPADNAAWSLEMARVGEAIERNRRARDAQASGTARGASDGDARAHDADPAQGAADGERAFWWAQDGADVEVRVRLPNGVRARDLDVELRSEALRCGVRGRTEPLFRADALYAPIRAGESTWEVCEADASDVAAGARADARMLVLTLAKADGEAYWPQLRRDSAGRRSGQGEKNI
ncbi:hypothetical protein KFE25_012550 [Diacronema lutheri]|uniref:CS domain-containing protein n=2 Tax=Diacronema lutheri TaxID=2081491 RepID=A0A8J6C889_DIALT|nr:hypothetical protein KFE25_012550 [Diacronema lutheri]